MKEKRFDVFSENHEASVNQRRICEFFEKTFIRVTCGRWKERRGTLMSTYFFNKSKKPYVGGRDGTLIITREPAWKSKVPSHNFVVTRPPPAVLSDLSRPFATFYPEWEGRGVGLVSPPPPPLVRHFSMPSLLFRYPTGSSFVCVLSNPIFSPSLSHPSLCAKNTFFVVVIFH